MTTGKRNGLGKIIKRRRTMIPLTLMELSAKSGVSISHLRRIESGNSPLTARVMHEVAKPLGFDDNELFTLVGFLSAQTSAEADRLNGGRTLM